MNSEQAESQAAGTPPRDKMAARPNNAVDDVEEELWKGSYSPKAMIPAFAIAGVLSVLALVATIWMPPLLLGVLPAIVLVFAGLGLRLWLIRLSTAYRLTTQRLVHESGLLRRTTNRLEVIDIDDVTIEQGLIDRFLGIGRIKLSSSDRTDPVLPLRGVENVREVADKIDHARRTERIRRGLHIEAV